MKFLVTQAATSLTGSSRPDVVARQGYDISITSIRQIESLEAIGCQAKIGPLFSRTSIPQMVRDGWRIRRDAKEFGPRVIHAHYGSMVGLCGWWASRGIAPFIVSFCGDDLEGTPGRGAVIRIRNLLSRYISRFVALRADAIIVKSASLAGLLPQRVAKSVSIIPNGIDIDYFSPLTEPLTSKPAAELTVLFNASSGGNATVKNPDLARSVVDYVKTQGLPVRLEVAGNLAPQTFRDRLQRCDCVLVTSLHEGSPNIVKEALACNIPVVSTDCGDVRERLQPCNKGGVFAPTAQALGNGLIAVLSNRERFNGRQVLMQQGLDDASVAAKVRSVYWRVSGR